MPHRSLSVDSSVFDKLQYCILFLSECQPAPTFCYGEIEHKATERALVCVTAQTWIICATPTMMQICETLCFDSDRCCADELVQSA